MDSQSEFFFHGPDFNFDFALTDSIAMNLYSYRILVFKIDSPSGHIATTEALKVGLQKLVERCPPLGGVVIFSKKKRGEQGGWKKALPGPGIKLVVRDLRSKLDYQGLEAREFPTDALKSEELIPFSLAPVMEGEAPASVFQYTWIKGGALLAVGIDHPIADGNGMNTLMRMLAEQCKYAIVEPEQQKDDRIPQSKAVIGTDRSPAIALENASKNKTRGSSFVYFPYGATLP